MGESEVVDLRAELARLAASRMTKTHTDRDDRNLKTGQNCQGGEEQLEFDSHETHF